MISIGTVILDIQIFEGTVIFGIKIFLSTRPDPSRYPNFLQVPDPSWPEVKNHYPSGPVRHAFLAFETGGLRAGHAVADFVGTTYFNSDHSPAPSCSPLLSYEGRGGQGRVAWVEIWGSQKIHNLMPSPCVSTMSSEQSGISTFLWRLEITRSSFPYLLVVWYSLYLVNIVGKYSFSRARQLQPSHRSSRTSSTPASLPSLLVSENLNSKLLLVSENLNSKLLLVSENLNSNRITPPLAKGTQVGHWPVLIFPKHKF